MIATLIVSGVLIRVKLHRLWVSNSTFMRHQLLSKAIGAIMLPYEVKTVLKYVINQKLSFPVKPESETALSLRETLYLSKVTILIKALLAIGLAFVNPLGIVYKITWLIPFSASPIVIYYFFKAMGSDNQKNRSRFSDIFSKRDPVELTYHRSQPEKVSFLLDSTGMMYKTNRFFILPPHNFQLMRSPAHRSKRGHR